MSEINIFVVLCDAGDMSSSDLMSEELQQNVDGFAEDDFSVSEEASIECIPDEILEYIITLTSPYCDFKSALQVSKRWYSVTKSMFTEIHCFLFSGF